MTRRRSRVKASRKPSFSPAQASRENPGAQNAFGKLEIAVSGAVCLVAAALIALIWIMSIRASQDQRTEVRERTSQMLLGQASVMSEAIVHEIQLINQSLTILQALRDHEGEAFDLAQWKQAVPLLTDVAGDVFIADEKGIIRQDILPQAIGHGIATAYSVSLNGSLEHFESDGSKDRQALLLTGQTGAGFDGREFLTYVVRPLDQPKGWLIGASFRSSELSKLFAGAKLGFNPVLALVDTKLGGVQAVMGPPARQPNLSVARSPLFNVIKHDDSGTWTGLTPIDGVERIHAFHIIPKRDLALIVGVSSAEAMVLADSLNRGTYTQAGSATALVLLAAGLIIWEVLNLRSQRRRLRILDRNRIEIERLRGNETMNINLSHANAARLQAVLAHMAEGAATFDAGLRLVQWNRPFQQGMGLELRPGIPLDTMFREQASLGLFGSVADAEVEIARRMAVLRAGDPDGVSQTGPDGETLALRGLPLPDGGFVMMLGGLMRYEAGPATLPMVQEVDPPPVAGSPVPAVVLPDW